MSSLAVLCASMRGAVLTASLALGLAAASSFACGPAPPTATVAEAGLQRLALRPLHLERRPATRDVARLTAPRGVRPWRIDASSHELTTIVTDLEPQPLRALTLQGKEPRSITVPGPFGAGAFTQVATYVHVQEAARLRVELLRGGEPVVRSEVQRVPPSRAVQRVTFDLPTARHELLPADALRIVVVGGGACRVGPLDLVDRPLVDWLPVGHVARPVFSGGEARRAVGLSSTIPLRAEFTVPGGGVLEVGAALAAELMPSNAGARLVVELVDVNGRRSAASLVLSSGERGVAPWRTLRLELGAHAGQRVEFTLTLVAERAREAFALVAEPTVHVPTAGPPTVLLVTADAHRADHFGAHSASKGLATPALDALASTGRLFEDCWSTSNAAPAAHAAMMTGRAPQREEDAATLAERFAAAGWATVAVLSAEDLVSEADGALLVRGFERLDSPQRGTRTAEATVERALALLADAHDRPLFLWVHVAGTRTPFEPPTEHLRVQWPVERGGPFSPARPAVDLPESVVPEWLRGLRELDFPAAQYRAELIHQDEQLARLFTEPRLAGGVLAYTASHGLCLGEHSIWWDSAALYPEVLHVPLVVAGAGIEAGSRERAPISHTAVGRMLLDLAGLVRVPFPGRAATAGTQRIALADDGSSAALREGSLLYLRWFEDDAPASRVGSWRAGDAELYDLFLDSGCSTNLLASDPERAARMDVDLRAAIERGQAED